MASGGQFMTSQSPLPRGAFIISMNFMASFLPIPAPDRHVQSYVGALGAFSTCRLPIFLASHAMPANLLKSLVFARSPGPLSPSARPQPRHQALGLFEIRQGPRLVEKRFGWTVPTEIEKPTLVACGLDPVRFEALWGSRAKVKIDRAIGI